MQIWEFYSKPFERIYYTINYRSLRICLIAWRLLLQLKWINHLSTSAANPLIITIFVQINQVNHLSRPFDPSGHQIRSREVSIVRLSNRITRGVWDNNDILTVKKLIENWKSQMKLIDYTMQSKSQFSYNFLGLFMRNKISWNFWLKVLENFGDFGMLKRGHERKATYFTKFLLIWGGFSLGCSSQH